MRCDFCKNEGTWQEDKFKSKAAAQARPLTIGAHFPWNIRIMPAGCGFDHEGLIRHGIVTHHACPSCYRNA